MSSYTDNFSQRKVFVCLVYVCSDTTRSSALLKFLVTQYLLDTKHNSANFYLFKVNNKNTRKM